MNAEHGNPVGNAERNAEKKAAGYKSRAVSETGEEANSLGN